MVDNGLHNVLIDMDILFINNNIDIYLILLIFIFVVIVIGQLLYLIIWIVCLSRVGIIVMKECDMGYCICYWIYIVNYAI